MFFEHLHKLITTPLNQLGRFIPQLGLRLLLAYEFWAAGLEKFHGENWFSAIHNQFPFPFSIVPTDISWFLATWLELLGAIALLMGLATRFFSFALIILTVVAWYSVHAGLGYNVCNNGYQLPLMYTVLFLPLLLTGAGNLSMDHYLVKKYLPHP
jgi:putative oxidoreductase